MRQNLDLIRQLESRERQLLIVLFIYGESRVSELEDEFDVSRETLRRDLDQLASDGYVEVEEEVVGGAANPANNYSLSSKGGSVASELTVSDENQSVLEALDEQSQRIAELEARVDELEVLLNQVADAQEHYLEQLIQLEESRGNPIVRWTED
jgi:predicted ArsR family transcriptional regulator